MDAGTSATPSPTATSPSVEVMRVAFLAQARREARAALLHGSAVSAH